MWEELIESEEELEPVQENLMRFSDDEQEVVVDAAQNFVANNNMNVAHDELEEVPEAMINVAQNIIPDENEDALPDEFIDSLNQILDNIGTSVPPVEQTPGNVETNQILDLERIFCVFDSHRRIRQRGIQFVAVCNLTARCH